MTFRINGVDILPYIAFGGLKWTRSDVDGPNAGRLMSGELQRDRVATKGRWDVTCRPLTSSERAMIMSLIEPEFYQLIYTDLDTNTDKTGAFYSNNFSVDFLLKRPDGEEYWKLSFPVIQR